MGSAFRESELRRRVVAAGGTCAALLSLLAASACSFTPPAPRFERPGLEVTGSSDGDFLTHATKDAQKNCDNQAEEDSRPYTLCVSETRFNTAEAAMQAELEVLIRKFEGENAARSVRRLQRQQANWEKRRDRSCEKEWADSPSTQVARNILDCQLTATVMRTGELRALLKQ